MADLLLLTKTDLPLVDSAALTALKQRLQKLSPSARWLTPVTGTFEPSAILALDHIEPVQSATLLNQWLDVKPVTKVKFSAATPSRLFMG